MRRSVQPKVVAATGVLLALGGATAYGQVPAFSGADGAGKNATGGRGGLVYHVTKLDKNFSDSGPGTLRYGLTDSNFSGQKRTIVFDVAGTFWLGRYGAEKGHDNGWDTQSRYNLGSNVTIAGQTAPGPVYIMGGVVKGNGTNTILRNVTVAPGYGLRNFYTPESGVGPTPGDFPDSYLYDAIDISGSNLMIDHVSTMYATDEHISANETTQNVTVQYSSMSQGQNYPQFDPESSGGTYTGHALGSLLSIGNTGYKATVSFHHNLYAHQKARVPQMQGGNQGGYYDFRNNVFYNWLGTAGSKSGTTFLNLVNNFYLAGHGGDNPVGGTSTAITTADGGTGILSASSTIYRSGNLLDSNKDADANDGAAVNNTGGSSSAIWMDGTSTYLGVTNTAQAAYDDVLNYMGSNWWTRDGVIDTPDERIINEVRTGTGKIVAWADDPFNGDPNEGVEWRSMLSYRADPTTGAAPFNRDANWDTDQDGMPNAWEAKHGLDPSAADNNGDFDIDGYTNLEEYINEVAEWPASAPVVFKGATSTRYAVITNWNLGSNFNNVGTTSTSYWQPSKYDVAQIQGGTAVVDAVGQHAGILQVAGPAAASAELNITAGWIEVANTLNVGTFTTFNASGAPVTNTGTGVVTQTGGSVTVANAVVLGGPSGAAGTYNLQGGVLSTTLLTKGATGGTFNFTGGTLHADNIGFSLVDNGGTISPGHSIGHTEIAGGLTINAGSLEIELDGLNADTIGVNGAAILGGTLDVSTLNGFTPQAGDFWTILIATGGISGRFTHVTDGYQVSVSGNNLVLTALVPEPTFGALALVGLLGLGRRSRRSGLQSGCSKSS